jgi:hypothetical protein
VCKRPAAEPPPLPPPPPPPPRDGSGSWDDLDEKQVHLTLSNLESERATNCAGRLTLEAAVCSAVRRNELTAFANAPRYDRLILSCKCSDKMGRATYTVEAGLEAFDGAGWWTTTDYSEADLSSQGFLRISAATLLEEYGGVLRFLELCRRLGAPRYTMRTSLDPDAKPHVSAVKSETTLSLACLFAEQVSIQPLTKTPLDRSSQSWRSCFRRRPCGACFRKVRQRVPATRHSSLARSGCTSHVESYDEVVHTSAATSFDAAHATFLSGDQVCLWRGGIQEGSCSDIRRSGSTAHARRGMLALPFEHSALWPLRSDLHYKHPRFRFTRPPHSNHACAPKDETGATEIPGSESCKSTDYTICNDAL